MNQMRVVASYIHASRPWSLTAALLPILVVSAVIDLQRQQAASDTVTPRFWEVPEFYFVLGAGAFGLLGTNYANSYYDFVNKLDKMDAHGYCSDPTLLMPKPGVTPGGVFTAMCGSFFMAAVFCALLWPHVSVPLMCTGIFLGLAYTAPPFQLKYRGLGDLCSFICLGPVLGSSTEIAMTGALTGVLGSAATFSAYWVPLALLTECIMHTNNIRDMETDRAAGVPTLANTLGFRASWSLLLVLLVFAYSWVAWLAVSHSGCLGVFLTLPLAIDIMKSCDKSKSMTNLPEQVAKLHTAFGVLYLIGLYFR
ncbi:hypothetical protein DIPPA_56604 [Diplonema papillatum]|nr:hypothetical protein DIPPA_56604 [Diplonema papillatum]